MNFSMHLAVIMVCNSLVSMHHRCSPICADYSQSALLRRGVMSSREELSKMSLKLLKHKCKTLKLSKEGSKNDCIARLLNANYSHTPCEKDKSRTTVPCDRHTSVQKKKKKTKKKAKKKKTLKILKNEQTPKRPPIITNNIHKLKHASFYTTNKPLCDVEVDLFEGSNSQWIQKTHSYSNYYQELLQITFCGMKPTIGNQETAENEPTLSGLFAKSQRIHKHVMCELLAPYVAIASIVDILLLYNGPHILPIRYSVDLLPYFHTTIRNTAARKTLWKNADKDTNNGTCSVDFGPKSNIIVIEDIYDVFVSHIKARLSLREEYNEEAILYIPSGKVFMNIYSNQTQKESFIKERFTRLYLKELCNFKDCTEYAFRMDLGGINYQYFAQKRERSSSPSISWGSRSRCWDGDGLVLLSDGSTKRVKELAVGDAVAVLDTLPNGVSNGCTTAKVTVKIESIVDRPYEMVLVNERLWITPYHAVLNMDKNEWKMPCDLNEVRERYVKSIYNFILDVGHVLCVNDIWACTLGHDLCGHIIENPIWGSSDIMHQMWSKKRGYPNVVEYI
eukprot:310486_1